MLEEKILDLSFYKKNKVRIREIYKKQDLKTKYKIKRILYSSSLSDNKKDEIWDFLNEPTEVLYEDSIEFYSAYDK